MKVLMLNGSCKANGNTYQALEEAGRQLKAEGIDYEIFQIGPAPVRDCIGCGRCTDEGCVFTDDSVNEFIAKAKEADASSSAHPCITPTRAGVYFLSLIACSTAARTPSPSSPVRQSR